jgi:hypothetical protein
MTDTQDVPAAITVGRRLRDAINAHDLDAMVDCFAPGFRSELPTFPDASFTGNENVRRNRTVVPTSLAASSSSRSLTGGSPPTASMSIPCAAAGPLSWAADLRR